MLLPRLPGARRKAAVIAEILGGVALTGKEVTPSAVMERLQTADYVHIAAHG